MAIAIKNIPVLKEAVAEKFVADAKANAKKRATIDFSKQVKYAQEILKKATFK